jgi:hypothetical protein
MSPGHHRHDGPAAARLRQIIWRNDMRVIMQPGSAQINDSERTVVAQFEEQ